MVWSIYRSRGANKWKKKNIEWFASGHGWSKPGFFFFWIELNLVESLRKMNKEFVAVNTKAFVSNNSMNTYLFNVDKKDT